MIVSYLIKMTLCAFLLLAVYFLFLEKENMHRFKRFYLIGSLVFSLLVPFISLELSSTPFPIWDKYTPAIEMEMSDKWSLDTHIAATMLNRTTDAVASPSIKKVHLLFIYLLMASFLLLRYLYNISQLLFLISNHKIISYKHAKLVLMENNYITFSFWKYIFIRKDQFYNGEIRPEILSHELAHIRQKHTLDILFIELVAIVFWFNPVVYLYKKSIRLNHEFLADEDVVKKTNNTTDYQLVLLNEIKNNNNLKLASYFNYLITKKRFIMMTKRTSLKTMLCKGSIGIVAMLVVFCFFSVKTGAQEIKEVPETTIHPDDIMIIPESGVTSQDIDVYKSIVDKYLVSADKDSVIWKSRKVSEEDWKALYPIYLRMTKEQRKEKHYIWFMGPLNPLKLRAPNKHEWNSAKGSKNKRIWLDGKEVTSTELNSYNRHNIAYFIRDYANNDYSYLWTQKGIEEYQSKYQNGISLSELFMIKPQIWFSRGSKSTTVLEKP